MQWTDLEWQEHTQLSLKKPKHNLAADYNANQQSNLSNI